MPCARAKFGRERGARVYALACGARAGGLIAVGGIDPPIAKSDEKLTRLLIGGFLGARRAFRRFVPAVSDLFSHRMPLPVEVIVVDQYQET